MLYYFLDYGPRAPIRIENINDWPARTHAHTIHKIKCQDCAMLRRSISARSPPPPPSSMAQHTHNTFPPSRRHSYKYYSTQQQQQRTGIGHRTLEELRSIEHYFLPGKRTRSEQKWVGRFACVCVRGVWPCVRARNIVTTKH